MSTNVSAPQAKSNGTSVPTEPVKVAYLYGTSHCGSTLMAFLADCHPQIASLGESKPHGNAFTKERGMRATCSCKALVSECPVWTDVFNSVKSEGFLFDHENWTNRFRFHNKHLHRLLTTASRSQALNDVKVALSGKLPIYRRRFRRVAKINELMYRSLLKVQGADVAFDTAKNYFRLQQLLLTPTMDVYVLRMIRDMRAYVNSMKRKGKSASDSAEHWVHMQRAGDTLEERLGPERVWRLRYEDFCHDSQGKFDELSQFLGVQEATLPSEIEPSDHHIIGNAMRKRGTIRLSLDEKWRTGLTPDELETSMRIAGDANASYGYE